MRILVNKENEAILRAIVSTDFKVRYQSSVLGYVWSLLKPMFMFGILYVLFTYAFPQGSKGIESYGVWLLMGIVLWNFFSEATMIGTRSVVDNGQLIRKVAIPRHLLVIASSVSALINLGLGMIVVILFAFLSGLFPTFSWLLLIPAIAELFILSVGLSLLLSALYVIFRDIAYIWEILLQAGLYASGIIFAVTSMPSVIQKIAFLNPITQIIQDARHALMPNNPASQTIWQTFHNPLLWFIPITIVIVIFGLGSWYFQRRQRFFAEDI
ncbi:ABC transporter permease [Candidatus Nanosynbacter sp. TM7-087]|jgi:ABC-type polysaccharide/polyol phosphate export system, permease component|uniref:ABC transporter permease n=1 Tax=Candidatus Nanosynbacter sp. TM7-087 TaxID=2902631 RepID=UPI001FB64C65|nr:ABC transporter permease [Candidatus Nanosynbacter sp. TM7-087]MCJ1966660.1 ABC transporter permease [Candidatus Nanosynbacter sp. TM7-087]